MVYGREVVAYALDLIHGARQYPCGWMRPNIVRGYFEDSETGRLQRLFFGRLLQEGFRRTHWQLVFPEQTAGLVKKVPPDLEGVDEYHVRFYSDGVIDCELEVNRFNGWHWAGPRRDGRKLLERILTGMSLPEAEAQGIRKQFGVKPYSDYCSREK